MSTVIRELSLPVSADEAWQLFVVPDHPDHPDRPIRFLPRSAEHPERHFRAKFGEMPIEGRVLTVDPALRRIAYTLHRWPPGAELHAASLQIRARLKGASLTWATLVKPDGLAPHVAAMMDAELDHARAVFEQLAAEYAAE